MDMEQEELQFLGFFGILAESYKLIVSRRRIFSQITLSLILPLSLLVLVHTELSELLSGKIISDEIDLGQTEPGTNTHNKLADLVRSDFALLLLFKAAYLTFLLVFSLLSTSAVVYTIASVYTSRNDLSFSKVMSVVPKVWKRLVVTFLWMFLAFFVYHVVAFFLLVAIVWVFLFNNSTVTVVVFFSFMVLYALGIVYMTLVWQLACVVSVLEEARGIEAMKKSKALMKGKMWTSVFIFGVLVVMSFLLQFAFQRFVVQGNGGGAARVGYAVLCLAVSVMLMLFGLVVQTSLYFVCKSFHHENIDKSALSDHLEVYLGEYVPLTAKDIQLEQYQV